ncbi:MAG: hypothetical protein E7507_05685 [Ruminococcus sp.]|nr:hypothetical protein [Ruminococcus sp.]
MNSKIVYVAKEKTDEIKSCILHNDDIFIAEIEGAKIKTEADYVQAMSSAFSFPHELPSMKIGWYNDYICDLMWIKQKNIVLIIHEFDLMLCDEPELKKIILDDFKEIILPWWNGEVVGHMVGGAPRDFCVYLEQASQ